MELQGVSVVICCHNGAQRLPRVLSHLEAQCVPTSLEWEVILIDNASSDDTHLVAYKSWPWDHSTPLRIIHEPKLGLSYARIRGMAEAKYPLITFIDDDNWVSSNWVELVAEVMSQHPDIGACGGFTEPAYEVSPPVWFEAFRECYAIGPQGEKAGDITGTRSFLWGAGLTVRATAWQQLAKMQFKFLLIDRQGTTLGAGSDSELCYALRLAGWRLWYEPRLRMRHFIPQRRLEWTYLRHVCRGFGAASVGLAPYIYALEPQKDTFWYSIKQNWYCQVLATLFTLSKLLPRLLSRLIRKIQNDPEVLSLEGQLGKLFELMQRRTLFDRSFSEVKRLTHSPLLN
jgi:glycosyltransferase involved in cell wall biosynthesis